MVYRKSFAYKRLVCLVLVLIISTTVVSRPTVLHAEPITITTGVALKVFALALGSMGVLDYVNRQSGGVESFFDGFSNEMLKSQKDVTVMLFDIFKDSLINKTKLKFNEISSYIKSYFESTYTEYIPDLEFSANLSGLKFLHEGTFDMSSVTWGNIKSFYFPLANNYFLRIACGYLNISGHGKIGVDATVVLGEGATNFVSGYKAYALPNFPYSTSDNMLLKYKVQLSDEFLSVESIGINHTKNVSDYAKTLKIVNPISDLSGVEFDFSTLVVPRVNDIPSDGISFDFGKVGINLNDFVGQRLDELFGAVSDFPFDTYKDRLVVVPGVDINTLPNTKVHVDENDVISDVEVSDTSDVVDDTTGSILDGVLNIPILGDILRVLNGILDFLKSLLKSLTDMLKSIFIPDVDILKSHVDDMKSEIDKKINYLPYIPIFNDFKNLQGEPIPDMYFEGSKIFDASRVNAFALTFKLWQRWFYYLAIAFYNLNNIYKLIRSSDVVSPGGDI